MSTPFDVVVVPDFSGKAARTFEARTLYFLASWLEYARVDYPLHLACIGEPPATVRALAKKCGAIISVHAPAPPSFGVYGNKLAGFDVPLQTKRIALLDVDILLLSSLQELAAAVPADAISANPSHGPIILPDMFEALYQRLGLPMPEERMQMFHHSVTLSPEEAAEQLAKSPLIPTYNSGVIVCPGDSPLPALFKEYLVVLGDFRPTWEGRLKGGPLILGDEPAFAAALHALKLRRLPFVRLPDRFNVRWRHLYYRSQQLDTLCVFHMTSSFFHGTSLAEKLDPSALSYQKKLLERYGKCWLRDSRSRVRGLRKHLLPATLELRELQPLFQGLYSKHIRPVLGSAAR